MAAESLIRGSNCQRMYANTASDVYFYSMKLKLNLLEGLEGNIWSVGWFAFFQSCIQDPCSCYSANNVAGALRSKLFLLSLVLSLFYLFNFLCQPSSVCLTLSGALHCSFFPLSAPQVLLIQVFSH